MHPVTDWFPATARRGCATRWDWWRP